MSPSRWIDHSTPWIAFGAIASTGIYEPRELGLMVAPLALAALVEWRRWDLASWRRPLEFLALAAVALLYFSRIGLVPTVVVTLFLLTGIRLALPRELPQRRQVLLMAFVIWITTALSTFELHFLGWSILWVLGAGLTLLQQAWESSASLRAGPLQRPPYRRVPLWALGVLLAAAGFFMLLPRLTLGFRAFPWGVAGLTSTQSGLSETVDLTGGGAIASNSEVVLRVIPPAGISLKDRGRYEDSLALLKGLVLETLDGQRWEPAADTPPPPVLDMGLANPLSLPLDYFVAPSPQGILPIPYGVAFVLPPAGVPVRRGPGGSLRWMYPTRRPLPLSLRMDSASPILERPPSAQRTYQLTRTGTGTESADAWSRRRVPDTLPAGELASRLTAALRSFSYTLDNPSGSAANPLQDFLERSHAGHCEYFASALALMLRYRGVPARVASGYRLGPWIEEGGYWLVTQNEAHSWVEFYDADARRWRVADPTPTAPPGLMESGTFMASVQRWLDAMRYRWDRHVVRFSSEDQMAGLDWARSRAEGLELKGPGPAVWITAGVILLLAGSGIWLLKRPRRGPAAPSTSGALVALRPLLRVVPEGATPLGGETAHQWLLRLAALAPGREIALRVLAREADAVAYGGSDPKGLKAMAREEARTWKRGRA